MKMLRDSTVDEKGEVEIEEAAEAGAQNDPKFV